MDGPILSVVIPTYRKPELLARTLGALEACARELDAEVEVVVVDDGSQDPRTRGVIGAAAAHLPLVDAGSEENRGRAAARNRGWRAASGRWILFLDDDILLEPTALRAHAEAQEAAEGVYLGEVVTDPEIVDSPLFDYLDSRGVAKRAWGEEVPARYFLTQNASVPRWALERVGGFDEEFRAYGFEDMEIAFRLEDRCELVFRSLDGARGEHVHHHALDDYLAKKVECGRHTIPRIASLHPHRLAEMHLDVLPELRSGASPRRRAEAVVLDLLGETGGQALLRWWVDHKGPPLPRPLRHRAYDLLVLLAYRRGLLARRVSDRQE